VSVSPTLSSASNLYQASQSDNGWQQFAQLVRAVNAGDLPASQKAYTKFTESSAADVVHANPKSRIAQALNQIGEALQSGDLARAQHALSSMRPPSPQTGARAGVTVPVDPNAPGAKLNVTV
jgi:hypothetical protein